MKIDRTYRFEGVLNAAARDAMETSARNAGGTLTFGEEGSQRNYALVSGAPRLHLDAKKAYDGIVIALSIEPTPADALPDLARACAGPGAPSGILACNIVENAVVLEVEAHAVAVTSAMIGVEMRRLGGSRRTRMLTPLPLEAAAAIAASGTSSPNISPERVLEKLIADAALT